MKFRILSILLLLPGILFSQIITEENLQKLDLRFFSVIPKDKVQISEVILAPKLNPIEILPDGTEKYGAIIYTKEPNEVRNLGVWVNSVLPGFVTARLTAQEILKLVKLTSVTYVSSDEYCEAQNDVARGYTGVDLLNSGYINNTPFKGKGIIIGLIDSGIDWTHGDFRDPADPTKSRILYIWDQTLTAQGSETPPSGFSYGVEYTKAQIENELDGTPAGFVREKDTEGHGTHVSGIAAGNGASLASRKYAGMAPEADIIMVKSSAGLINPMSNVIDGLTYLKNKIDELGRPAVVNLSIMTPPCGPHDGTDPQSVAIDNFISSDRPAVIGAGNDGDNNIHTMGTIPAGSYSEVTLNVPSYTPAGGSSNDNFVISTWISGNYSVTGTLYTPSGGVVTINPGANGTFSTRDGGMQLQNIISPDNGDRQLFILIFDYYADTIPRPGTWKLRLTNNADIPVTFHSWLCDFEIGDAAVTLVNGNSDYTIGNAAWDAIVVGSYATRWRWTDASGNGWSDPYPDKSDDLSPFSSKGPTRDGRTKPDITAPGQYIGSSKSADCTKDSRLILPGGKHVVERGTSMATPVTTGTVALLLEQNSSIYPEDIRQIISVSAKKDNYTGTNLPDNGWGYGKLDAFMAMSILIDQYYDMSRDIIAYDEWNIDQGYFQFTNTNKAAVRFTSNYSGQVGGCFFHSYSTVNLTGPIYAEVWSDNGSGMPGAKMGSTVTFDKSKILDYSWNYINMRDANVKVTAGQSFYIVLYFTSGSSIYLFADAANVDGRSYKSTGSSWTQVTAGDYKIRADVTKDVSGLPVELVSFEARTNNNNVMLFWLTATEVNSYMFEVERRISENKESQWTKVAEINAAGNSNSPKEYRYTDKNLSAGLYNYRLKMVDQDGTYEYSDVIKAEIITPKTTALMQNYPNPFNPNTKINYSLASKNHVRLIVYDILGNEVATLADEIKPAGSYTVEFNAGRLSSGIYFYKLTAGEFTQIKKFTLMK